MKPTILCDVDGVLVDWFSRFPYFLQKKGMPFEHAIQMYAHGHWQSLEQLTGLPSDEARALCDEYSESRYMEYLTPYKDALMAVNHLKHKYDFVAVTAVSKSPETLKHRSANLEFWFPGAFSKVICVGADTTKLNILMKYNRTIWIDDSPNYVAEGVKAGHDSIRLVRDSRVDVCSSYVAKDWQEVSNLIKLILPV